MNTTIPEWVIATMSDTLSHAMDYHIEQAREWGLRVQVVFGVGPSPECLALVVEDVSMSTHHADGTVTRDPQEFRLISYTGEQVSEVGERVLATGGYEAHAMRNAEEAFARALLLVAMQPELKDSKWWQAQPDRDYNQFWLVPAVGGE